MTTNMSAAERWTALRRIGPFGGLQIVPTRHDHELLSDPAAGAGPVGPLAYHGGKLINQGRGRLVNVYLDSPALDVQDFNDFTNAICAPGVYVSPDGSDTTGCQFLGGVSLRSGLSGTVKNSQLAAFITASVGRTLPASDPWTNYSLILPAGLQVAFDDGSGSSCSDFCGYHTRTAGGIYYGVICDTTCPGCHGSETEAQARQSVQFHEYVEWRSDPDGGGYYNDDTGAENGDECAWLLRVFDAIKGWFIQPEAVNGVCFAPVNQVTPPPSLWAPKPGAPLAAYFTGLLADPSLLSASGAAGDLLAYVLAHPSAFQAGQPLTSLLGWLQQNPSGVAAAMNGAGWGAYLDGQGVA